MKLTKRLELAFTRDELIDELDIYEAFLQLFDDEPFVLFTALWSNPMDSSRVS